MKREMVLNHASALATGRGRSDISRWLADLALGIGSLVDAGVVKDELRTMKEFHEVECLSGWSLYNAILEMPLLGYRDESLRLARLATKSPLLRDLPADVEARFYGCEGVADSPEDGEPLLLCAVTDWVAVGLPSAPRWDQDSVIVEFDELLSDETTERASESVDNLTRLQHAGAIILRHADSLAHASNPRSLWNDRKTCFPNLEFGPRVEDDLQAQQANLATIVRRLTEIDQAAAEWKAHGGPAPRWRTRTTDESTSLEPKYLKERWFPSYRGTSELFTWHARFGKRGRIHLRFDATSREIEIGYIGKHLKP